MKTLTVILVFSGLGWPFLLGRASVQQVADNDPSFQEETSLVAEEAKEPEVGPLGKLFNQTVPLDYVEKTKKEIEIIKNLDPKDYPSLVEKHRQSIENYINYQRRKCKGEFSTIVLKGGKELSSGNSKTLSKEEKKLCYREMKFLHVAYINGMYEARKKYLDYLHRERISNLSTARDKMINDLNSRLMNRGD